MRINKRDCLCAIRDDPQNEIGIKGFAFFRAKETDTAPASEVTKQEYFFIFVLLRIRFQKLAEIADELRFAFVEFPWRALETLLLIKCEKRLIEMPIKVYRRQLTQIPSVKIVCLAHELAYAFGQRRVGRNRVTTEVNVVIISGQAAQPQVLLFPCAALVVVQPRKIFPQQRHDDILGIAQMLQLRQRKLLFVAVQS